MVHDELFKLDTQDACNEVVVASLRSIQKKGTDQYKKYVQDVLENGSSSISNPIKRNSFPLMSTSLKKITTGTGKKLKVVKTNAEMFAQLVAVMQQREVSLENLFSHEIHFFSPAISDGGNLNLPSAKSTLVHDVLTSCYATPTSDNYDAYIIDGAHFIHVVTPRPDFTFRQYGEKLKISMEFLFESCSRIDLVFDVNLDNSLKAATRQKRGKGVRKRVSADTKIQVGWAQFLRDDRNKEDLFSFLAQYLTAQSYAEGKILFVTEKDKVLCNRHQCMPDCDHEEADTRMMVHLKDCLSNGFKYICIISSDTDVLMILLGVFHKLQADYIFDDIVVTGKTRNDTGSICIKALAERLGQRMCQALPFLHAFTGCDTTSAFRGLSKKKGYDVLKKFSPALPIFGSFFNSPFQNITEQSASFEVIQRFVILMYSKTSESKKINHFRMELFFKKSQNLETIPPTENALLQHTKRAIYQNGVWGRCLEVVQNRPSPAAHGWKLSSIDPDIPWEPLWFTNGEASKECREFVKCGCQGEAGCVRCKCANGLLSCTMLCNCNCPNRYRFE